MVCMGPKMQTLSVVQVAVVGVSVCGASVCVGCECVAWLSGLVCSVLWDVGGVLCVVSCVLCVWDGLPDVCHLPRQDGTGVSTMH